MAEAALLRKGARLLTVKVTAAASTDTPATISVPGAGVITDIIATSHSNADFRCKLERKSGDTLLDPTHGDFLNPANGGRMKLPYPLPTNSDTINVTITDLSGSTNYVDVAVMWCPTEGGSPAQLNLTW